MPDNPPQGQDPGSNNTWQQEKARLEVALAEKDRMISGLSNERNSYRQRSEAWEKNVGSELGDMVKFDPVTGLPVGVEPGEGGEPPSTPPSGVNPFAGLVENPDQVSQYLQAQVQALVNQRGYITQPQAVALMQQAYQAAKGDFLVLRTLDQLMAHESYKALADYGSPLSKKTAEILQARQLGLPRDGAAGFDQWQYAGLEAPRLAADLARLALHEEAEAAKASAASGQANQQAAGLSVGQPGAAAEPPKAGEVPLTATGEPDWGKLRSDFEQRAKQVGIVT